MAEYIEREAAIAYIRKQSNKYWAERSGDDNETPDV